MDVCIQIYALYWVVAKQIPKVEGLCLLNKMIYWYISCTILKYIPLLLMSGLIFYTVPQLEHVDSKLVLQKCSGTEQKHLEFVVPRVSVLLVLIRGRPCLVQPYNPFTEAMLLVLDAQSTSREYCYQTTHEWEAQKCCCSILHEGHST